MTLSTVSGDCKPSSRVVLLKQFDNSGFVFFTNYESQKGSDLANNPNACLLFFWDSLERQVRIEGTVEKIRPGESDDYFQTRPYTSRIGAWASVQSRQLSGRFELMKKVAVLMAKYPKNVPLPPFWGGYRLKPNSFEFWQGRESRLHDRVKYTLENTVWNVIRLYP
jgi:pyridoxamine 5'-phosphate oxidase